MKTKYKEITTLKYFSFTRFLQGKIYVGRLKQPLNHKRRKCKQNPREEPCVSLFLGKGSKGGGVVVGEHVRGKAGLRLYDVLA